MDDSFFVKTLDSWLAAAPDQKREVLKKHWVEFQKEDAEARLRHIAAAWHEHEGRSAFEAHAAMLTACRTENLYRVFERVDARVAHLFAEMIEFRGNRRAYTARHPEGASQARQEGQAQ